MKTELNDIEITPSVINKSLIYILELCNKIEKATLYEESINELIEFYNKFLLYIKNIQVKNSEVKFLIDTLPKISLQNKIDFSPLPVLVTIIEIIMFPLAIYRSYHFNKRLAIIESEAANIKKSVNQMFAHPNFK